MAENPRIKQLDKEQENNFNNFLIQEKFFDLFGGYQPSNKSQNINGCDFKIFYKNQTSNVDMKARFTYPQEYSIKTNLECYFTNASGNNNIGWFLNENSITDYYMFAEFPECDFTIINEPQNDVYNYKYITNYKICEIVFIHKDKIMEFIESKGLSKNKIIQFSHLLKDYDNSPIGEMIFQQHPEYKTPTAYYFFKGISNIRLAKQYNKRTNPVNLVVVKDEMKKYAECTYRIINGKGVSIA